MKLTRNLADILPKDHARDSTALKAIDAAQVRCYNCGDMGHFSNECPIELSKRSKEAQERAAAKKLADQKLANEKRRKEQRVNAVKDAAAAKDADKDAKDSDGTDAADDKTHRRRRRPAKTCPVFASTRVCDIGSTPSRSAPVMEVAASIDGKAIRLDLDSLAGLSCVGSADLTNDERKRCVPTSERLHHAGGDALRSNGEIELPVEIAGEIILATFNVIDTGKHNLGFLFGMDLLERHEFVIDCARRKVTFCPDPMPQDDLLRFRHDKEKQLLSTGLKPVFTADPADSGNARPARVNTVRSIICLHETVIPPFSKLMVQGVFSSRPDDLLPDGTSRDFVFFPPDDDSKAAEKHFGLGLWPGLSRAQVSWSCRSTSSTLGKRHASSVRTRCSAPLTPTRPWSVSTRTSSRTRTSTGSSRSFPSPRSSLRKFSASMRTTRPPTGTAAACGSTRRGSSRTSRSRSLLTSRPPSSSCWASTPTKPGRKRHLQRVTVPFVGPRRLRRHAS